VPILGTATVCFAVAGITLQHKFLVSDAVEEVIFGSDWLVENRCHWDFENGILLLKSTTEPVRVHLTGNCVRQCVRRIYAKETVELKPGTQSDLSVRSVWSTIPSATTDWIVGPKKLRCGVMMARTLLTNDKETVTVRVVNCSPVSCTASAGELLTTAEPADIHTGEMEAISSDLQDKHVQCLILFQFSYQNNNRNRPKNSYGH